MLAGLEERCNVIEESYEFMLAYAAQGVGGQSSGEIRDYLRRAAKTVTGLAEDCGNAAEHECPEPAGRYLAFFAVIARDARDSLAAMELVLAQPAISSQLIDNLNASIHLRALLTDLFLLSEIIRTQPALVTPAA